MKPLRFSLAVAIALSLGVQGPRALAQSTSAPAAPLPPAVAPIMINYSAGYDTISGRIDAAGRYQLLMSQALVNYQIARIYHEEAIRRRYENRLFRIVTRHNIEREFARRKEERRDETTKSKLERPKRQFAAAVNATPDPAAAAGGHLINILLQRILLQHSGEYAATKPIPLESMVRDQVRVSTSTGANKGKSRIDGVPLSEYPCRPPKTTDDDMSRRLEDYVKARSVLIEAVKKKSEPSDEDLDRASEALFALRESFENWVRDQGKIRDARFQEKWEQWKFFLSQQVGQLKLFAVPALAAFKGSTVQELVDYINANGLQIAKADPGGENAYQSLYVALHSLLADLGDASTEYTGEGKGGPPPQ